MNWLEWKRKLELNKPAPSSHPPAVSFKSAELCVPYGAKEVSH